MTSFGTYEPSDAMLQAMQARMGAKNLAAAGYAEAEKRGEYTRPPQQSEVVGGFAVTAAPGFRMKGGLRDTPLVVVDSEPPEVSNEVFHGGGMSFGVKQVDDYVPSPTAAASSAEGGGNFQAGIGSVFSIGTAEASTSSPSRAGRSGPSPPRKGGRTPSHGDRQALRGPSPLAAKVRPEKKRQAAESFQPPISSRSGGGTPAYAGSHMPPTLDSRPPTGNRLGRPPSAPPSASRQEPSQEGGHSEMMDAADQALQKAMAQAAAGLPLMKKWRRPRLLCRSCPSCPAQ